MSHTDLTFQLWDRIEPRRREIELRGPDHTEVVANGRYMIYILKNGDTATFFDPDGDPFQPKPLVGFTTANP